MAVAVSTSGAPPPELPDCEEPPGSTVGELVGWSGGVPLGADPSEGGPMHWPMAVCSSGCGCLAFSSSYNCSPNTPIRQLLRVGSLVVKGLSNPAPDPGSEASGANVVLAGRVPGVGRVGVGGEVVDVVVAAGAPVVVADAAVVVLGATGGVKEVVDEPTVVAETVVVSGATVPEPPHMLMPPPSGRGQPPTSSSGESGITHPYASAPPAP
ncbi:MAG: hypothetical protein QF896_00050 [Acidimicrobiales bacterium]|nr:hypothetical protein [Acidimicrobiales bacterium]